MVPVVFPSSPPVSSPVVVALVFPWPTLELSDCPGMVEPALPSGESEDTSPPQPAVSPTTKHSVSSRLRILALLINGLLSLLGFACLGIYTELLGIPPLRNHTFFFLPYQATALYTLDKVTLGKNIQDN